MFNFRIDEIYENEDFLNSLNLKLNPNRLKVKTVYWNRADRAGVAEAHFNRFKSMIHTALFEYAVEIFIEKLNTIINNDISELKCYSYNDEGVIDGIHTLELDNYFIDKEVTLNRLIKSAYASVLHKRNYFYTIKTSDGRIIPFNLDGREIKGINNIGLFSQACFSFYGNVFLDNVVVLILNKPDTTIYEQVIIDKDRLKKLLHDTDLPNWSMSIVNRRYNVIKIEPFIKFNAAVEKQLTDLKVALGIR